MRFGVSVASSVWVERERKVCRGIMSRWPALGHVNIAGLDWEKGQAVP